MLNNVRDIIDASGPELLEPVGFGKFSGKRLYQISAADFDELAEKALIKKEVFYEQARASAELFRKSLRKEKKQEKLQMPKGLYAHQQEFIKKFYNKKYGGMFFEMGTGKTRTIIKMMELRWLAGHKALIICPRSVFSSWKKEIVDNSSFSCIVVSGTKEKKMMKLNANRDIYITNYETALNDSIWNKIINMKIDWAICDESHKIKNYKQKTTAGKPTIAQRIREFGGITEYRWCLTGTPLTNNQKDIWSQAYFLDRGETFGVFFSKFYKKYFSRGHFSFYAGSFKSEREELFTKELEKISMRATKNECLDLPSQTWIIREVELSGKALRVYKKVLEEATLLMQDKEIPIQYKIAEILRLRQICGGGVNGERFNLDKLAELDNILDETSDKPIIVANFKDEIIDIEKLLKSKKMTFGKIDGSRTQEQRDKDIIAFSKGELDAFVFQIEAGGVGVNGLQNYSSTMIFYSFPYKWDSVKQAESRIHRSGQARPCTYIYLTTALPEGKPTIETAVLNRLKEKDSNINKLIDDIREGIFLENE